VIRHTTTSSLLAITLAFLTVTTGSFAQVVTTRQLPPGSPFIGGVPEGPPSTEVLHLTVGDVIHRALEHNLGVLLAEQSVTRSGGTRWIALSQMMPNLTSRIAETRQRVNLEAFGIPLAGTGLPSVVGPFNVFDARIYLTQSLIDMRALNEKRSESFNVEASRYSYKNARDLVVLVAANVYLEALASSARAVSATAQLQTSQALYDQAQDLKQGGIVAGIDVLRAEVRLTSDKQRVTASQNDSEKARLQLARVIGLPIGQPFTLSEELPNVPVPDISVEQALAQAYRARPDYQAALQRVKAAEAVRAAASSEQLPSVRFNADYGALGLTLPTAVATYSLTGAVNIPIFLGGRTQGRIAEADADLRSRRAEAEDMRAAIYYDVQSAFLDLKANDELLQAATRGRDLAGQELTQARDRFAAGVSSNLEVVQAQQSVAEADEQYIDALLGFDVSKAVLARSLGDAEAAVERILGTVK